MKRLRLLAWVLLTLSLGGLVDLSAAAREAPPIWNYEVTAGAGGRELRIEARFARGSDELVLDEGLADFVRDAEIEWDGRWQPLERQREAFVARGCEKRGCRVRYSFLLGDAARGRRGIHRLFEHNGAFIAPPSSWLLRPRREPAAGRYRLRVETPPDATFVTGIFPSREQHVYEANASDLDQAPYSAFGPFETARVPAPGGFVDLAVSPGELALPKTAVREWVEASAKTVAAYYGRFPVPRALVLVVAGGRRPVGFGTTLGNGGAAIMIWVGRTATDENLARDWVLTHEMVHLGFPNLPRVHGWLEEGIATYVEPVARARMGALSVEELWRGLVDGMPHGMPEEGDEGLDKTRTWGRTYWGGALFCLMADVEIRERTGNRRSLDDALRGVLAAGGNIAMRWDLERVLNEADRAAGVPVLRELYDRMGSAPGRVDLADLWRRLGIDRRKDTLVFDEAAPLASIRRAIANGRAGDAADIGPLPLIPRP